MTTIFFMSLGKLLMRMHLAGVYPGSPAQNIGAQRVAGKIFWNKELAFLLWLARGARDGGTMNTANIYFIKLEAILGCDAQEKLLSGEWVRVAR
jgi:hypothetical protein